MAYVHVYNNLPSFKNYLLEPIQQIAALGICEINVVQQMSTKC